MSASGAARAADPAAQKPPKVRAAIDGLNLDFEHREGNFPAAWGNACFMEYHFSLDDSVVHGGKFSGHIRCAQKVNKDFGTITGSLKASVFAGQRVRFSGYLKMNNVKDFAALWIRADRQGKVAAFESMQGRKVNGTRDWESYSLPITIPPDADKIVFGVLLHGDGDLWADDLDFDVVVDDPNMIKELVASWLARVDNGDYDESWKAGAKKMRDAMTRSAWEARMKSTRQPLGGVVSREWKTITDMPAPPGAPAGQYMLVEERTTFEKKQDAIETIKLIREPTGQWKVFEYSVK